VIPAATGAPCAADGGVTLVCALDDHCDATSALCADDLASGSPCIDDEQCATPLVCDADDVSVCAAPPAPPTAGDACVAGACDLAGAGTSCHDDTCTIALVVDLGAECDDRGAFVDGPVRFCRGAFTDTYCARTDLIDELGVCTPRPVAGQPCGPGIPCALWDSSCAAADGDAGYACVALPSLGAPCLPYDVARCAVGLRCNAADVCVVDDGACGE
jgi:hypothetical protein